MSVAAFQRPNAALKEAVPDGGGVQPNHPAAARLVVVDRDGGVVEPQAGPARRRIAIVGFAGSTRELAPYDDPAWEVWGLNQLYRHIPRADRWFDIHWNWNEETVPGTDHRGWARQCGVPFYMLSPEPDIPTAVRYPIEGIASKLGGPYLTSSIAYMLALAIYEIDQAVREEFAEQLARFVQQAIQTGEAPDVDLLAVRQLLYARRWIGLFGVDLASGSEYFEQRPCAEYWLGQAAARGISVALPEESALCKGERYGAKPPAAGLLSSKEIAEHLARMAAERDVRLRQADVLEGARQADAYWKEVLELRERGAKG